MCKDFSPLLPSAAVIQPEQPHVSPAGPHQSAILNLTPSTSIDKPRPKLPVTQEDWEEANCYFPLPLPLPLLLSSWSSVRF